MRRHTPRWLTAALITVGLSLAAYAMSGDQPPPDAHCVEVPELGVYVCGTTTTSSSTSTTVDTTTTTQPTTQPTTTTTAPPGLVIPPTQPYPARGTVPYKDCGGYDIIARNAAEGVVWWTAPYWCADGLTAYPGGGGWLDGDREGYRCAYGFIEDDDGSIDGRFAFVRPPDALYAAVNDSYMDEGVRYLDGTLANEGQEIGSENCTDVLSDIDYNGACRDVDERPRVGFFDSAGNVLDIRDYTNTVANNVTFNLHSFDGERATVIACEDGLVGMIVYYDSLGDGQLAVDFNGTGPFG